VQCDHEKVLIIEDSRILPGRGQLASFPTAINAAKRL
jgi:hypothetical protein